MHGRHIKELDGYCTELPLSIHFELLFLAGIY